MSVFRLLGIPLLLLGFSSPVAAQVAPLKHGSLVFGESEKADVEKFLGEPLACQEAFSGNPPIPVEICAPGRTPSVRYPYALFQDGKLKMLRYQLSSRAILGNTIRGLTQMYGKVRQEKFGTGSASDLRYWEFEADPYVVLLSEVRSTKSGEVALRLLLSDRSGGWYQEVASSPASP